MNKSATAVVIPLYRAFLSRSEELSISFTLNNLSLHKVYFVSPASLRDDPQFSMLIQNYDIEVLFFDNKFFKNIDGYNKLMLSIVFYEKFSNYKYILICQLDALVLSDDLARWTNRGYDYVGAPWVTGGDSPHFDAMGNGGFSLRKVSFFKKVLTTSDFFFLCSKYYALSLRVGIKNLILIRLLALAQRFDVKLNYLKIFLFFYSGNEDYFWAFFANFFVKQKLYPSPHEALGFSFESNPSYCYSENSHNLPFGCHAWEKHDLEFWKSVIPEIQSIKD